jgi:4,5-dihydroxyphthalate decarboxylase
LTQAGGGKLALNVAIGAYGSTRGILDGSNPIAGVSPRFETSGSIIAAYRRMVRETAYDICELAPTTYLMAKAAGARFRAIPAFLMRHFHHSGMICRAGAQIGTPADLHGKRVGVRAWSVTTGVWMRGILAEEHDLDIDRVNWIVDDEEHVASLRLPANVTPAPAGRKLAEMFAAGELDAGIGGNAGIGANRPEGCHELFPDAAEREAAWYRRTGIYPVHALVVIRDELLDAQPWLAPALYKALAASRDRYVDSLGAGLAESAEDQRYQRIARIVGDPLPYGIGANRAAVEKLIDYALRQRLIRERPAVEDLFADVGA